MEHRDQGLLEYRSRQSSRPARPHHGKPLSPPPPPPSPHVHRHRPVQRESCDHYQQAEPVPYKPMLFPTPTVEYQETPEADIFVAQFPYVTKNDVKVEVEEGNVLCVTGEKKEERKATGKRRPDRVEPCSGQFQQRFKLPDHSNAELIQASWANGSLIIKVPKKIASYGHGYYHNNEDDFRAPQLY